MTIQTLSKPPSEGKGAESKSSAPYLRMSSGSSSSSELGETVDGRTAKVHDRVGGGSDGLNTVNKHILWGRPDLCVPRLIPGQRKITKFTSNVVTTSKYTVLNFIPLFLIEQFQRVANIYFLFVSLFEVNFFVPVATAPFNTSLTNGSSNTLMSLIAVIFIEGITVIIEDYARHKSDSVANNTIAHKYSKDNKAFVDAPWKDVSVGDIVRVDSGEKFPGDLLMLSAATAKGGGCAAAYVETKSLDGETNLKLRTAPEEIVNFFRAAAKEKDQNVSAAEKWELHPSAVHKLLTVSGPGNNGCSVTTQDPRDPKTPVSIHTFGGVVKLASEVARIAGTDKMEIPINEKNVLLREVSRK